MHVGVTPTVICAVLYSALSWQELVLNRKQGVEHNSLIFWPRVEKGFAGFSVCAESAYYVMITFFTECTLVSVKLTAL